MSEALKILGDKRRELILQWLKESQEPITGGDLAKKTNVSRQVIVQDISILKAKGESIMATSQGYVYLQLQQENKKHRRVIACFHDPKDTKEELLLLVDAGVTIQDVSIEHPIYGDLTASLRLSNRFQVEQFMKKLEETNAGLLSLLTDGTHLHTIEADSKEQLDHACQALKKANFLL